MPFDNSNPVRSYFRESTAALAALVETRPAVDVLRAVHAELVHRDRRAAVALRDQVAALLSAEVVAPVAKPRISVTAVLRPVVVAPAPVVEVVAPVPVVVAPAAAAKPRAAKAAKRPGDIGWRPKSLEAIIKSVGNASHHFTADEVAIADGNGLKALREFGLKATGWIRSGNDTDGYQGWARGADRLRVGPFGAIYLGSDGWAQMAREDRDALAEAGRPAMAEHVAAAKLRAKRAEARATARAAYLDAVRTRKHARATGAHALMIEGAKAKVARAWALRAEARAI